MKSALGLRQEELMMWKMEVEEGMALVVEIVRVQRYSGRWCRLPELENPSKIENAIENLKEDQCLSVRENIENMYMHVV